MSSNSGRFYLVIVSNQPSNKVQAAYRCCCGIHKVTPPALLDETFLMTGSLGNLWCCFWTPGVTWHTNMAQTLFFFGSITIRWAWNFLQFLHCYVALRRRLPNVRSSLGVRMYVRVPMILSSIPYLVDLPWLGWPDFLVSTVMFIVLFLPSSQFHCLISILLFPCTSIQENAYAWITGFL